jgi:hypothetical protein
VVAVSFDFNGLGHRLSTFQCVAGCTGTTYEVRQCRRSVAVREL